MAVFNTPKSVFSDLQERTVFENAKTAELSNYLKAINSDLIFADDESQMGASIKLMMIARMLITELISLRGSFMAFRKGNDKLIVITRDKNVTDFMAKLGLTEVKQDIVHKKLKLKTLHVRSSKSNPKSMLNSS